MVIGKSGWRNENMLSKSDYKFFEKARQVATISDFAKIHVGCIAVYQGNIIGIGCNTNKTHPIQKYYNRYRDPECVSNGKCLPKLHAEINCINSIRNLDVNFSKVKLYIYRIRNDRPFGAARPCPSCIAAIKDLGIRNIYYTTNDGFVHEKLEKYIERGVA